MLAEEATDLLSEATGDAFEVRGPLAGGETGATEVVDSHGRRFVLKWELDPGNQVLRRQGALLADRLRTLAAWPAPKQACLDIGGCLLVLQEFMDGRPVESFTHGLLDELEALHQSRVGLARDEDTDLWAEDMIETLVHGGNGYCLHEPLRGFDDRTRRIVERIEAIGRSLDPIDLVGRDVVHGDLHPGNLLQVDGALSAVVDMDYTRVGDASFDLTMLALSSLGVVVEPGVRSRLFEDGVAELSDARRSAYVGNLLLRFLDWPIRKGRTEEIEFWIAQADRLLPK